MPRFTPCIAWGSLRWRADGTRTELDMASARESCRAVLVPSCADARPMGEHQSRKHNGDVRVKVRKTEPRETLELFCTFEKRKTWRACYFCTTVARRVCRARSARARGSAPGAGRPCVSRAADGTRRRRATRAQAFSRSARVGLTCRSRAFVIRASQYAQRRSQYGRDVSCPVLPGRLLPLALASRPRPS